jgi:hypothetical protein
MRAGPYVSYDPSPSRDLPRPVPVSGEVSSVLTDGVSSNMAFLRHRRVKLTAVPRMELWVIPPLSPSAGP